MRPDKLELCAYGIYHCSVVTFNFLRKNWGDKRWLNGLKQNLKSFGILWVKMAETRCKSCNCLCHCSVVSHSDMLGICPCQMCKCDSKGVTVDETKECETCQ